MSALDMDELSRICKKAVDDKDFSRALERLREQAQKIKALKEAAKPIINLLDAHDSMLISLGEPEADDCLLGYVDGVYCTPQDLRNLKQAYGEEV